MWARQYTVFYLTFYLRLPEVTLLTGQNSVDGHSRLQPTTKPASIYVPRQEFQKPSPTVEAHSSRFSLLYHGAESWGHTTVTTVFLARWGSSAHFHPRAASSRHQRGQRRRKHQGKEVMEEVTCVYTDSIAPQGWVVGNNLRPQAASCACSYHGERRYQRLPSPKPSLTHGN